MSFYSNKTLLIVFIIIVFILFSMYTLLILFCCRYNALHTVRYFLHVIVYPLYVLGKKGKR
ncbi:hypothetical protein BCR42DRAFT_401382 [Absidia repens]|uniref:Uncharacterized protein n=1 Tax=Absidia repens TaxID=90262 RepID=A0A1X2J2F7_9FUNG|nr:hypothetical protein BCR42DRAFT_401382 [Absidia repens]